MLTDAQLRQTAVRVATAWLVEPDVPEDHEVDKLLCQHHCTGPDCDRADADAAEEIRAVHRHLEAIAAELRGVLDRYEQNGAPR